MNDQRNQLSIKQYKVRVEEWNMLYKLVLCLSNFADKLLDIQFIEASKQIVLYDRNKKQTKLVDQLVTYMYILCYKPQE